MPNPITNNLITLVSANSLNGLKTGHIIFDIIVALILVFLLPRLNGVWNSISFSGWLSKKDRASMKFIGVERHTTHSSGQIIREYSENFCAIAKYIERSGKVKVLKEYFLRSTFEGNEVQLRPQPSKPIKLTPTISCEISVAHNEAQDTIELALYSDEGLDDIQDFLRCVTRKYNDYMDEKLSAQQYYFCPCIPGGCNVSTWTHFPFRSNKTFSRVFFPEKREVLREIDYFLNGREIYEVRGVPWQLGILLHGDPGTGKSSFVKALAKYTDRHIIEVPLNRIKTYEALRTIMLGSSVSGFKIPHDKRLYLIEDIDCLDDVIQSRKKSKEKVKKGVAHDDDKDSRDEDSLRLSHILNIIDGMLEAPGRILVITTNYPDRLDEALIRDGRMDIKLEMKPIQGKCLEDMVLSFYFDKTFEDLKPFLPLENQNNYTPATIQGYCFKRGFEEVCKMLR